jgi:hypothetical protein
MEELTSADPTFAQQIRILVSGILSFISDSMLYFVIKLRLKPEAAC